MWLAVIDQKPVFSVCNYQSRAGITQKHATLTLRPPIRTPPYCVAMSKRARNESAVTSADLPKWHIGRRISIMTFNVWKGEDGEPALWPQRKHAIVQLLRHFRPDVLCIQEGHPILQSIIREALPDHQSISPEVDPSPCWANESNIFWHSGLFHQIEFGTEDVSISPTRRLHWVILSLNESQCSDSQGYMGKILKPSDNVSPGQSSATKCKKFIVSTAHLPWVGGKLELETGTSSRAEITRQVVAVLDRLCLTAGDSKTAVATDANKGEAVSLSRPPIFFMGDLNDDYHPTRILREV